MPQCKQIVVTTHWLAQNYCDATQVGTYSITPRIRSCLCPRPRTPLVHCPLSYIHYIPSTAHNAAANRHHMRHYYYCYYYMKTEGRSVFESPLVARWGAAAIAALSEVMLPNHKQSAVSQLSDMTAMSLSFTFQLF